MSLYRICDTFKRDSSFKFSHVLGNDVLLNDVNYISLFHYLNS